MKNISYLVEHKDDPTMPVIRFGPFASTDLAQQFIDALPKTRPGGSSRTVIVQPYTIHDMDLIAGLIITYRNRMKALA